MSDHKMTRRDLLRSAVTISAGGLFGAALAACQSAATPAPATSSSAPAATEQPAEATAPPTEAAQAGADIRCAGIFPLSGFIASDGEEMRNGVVMALDEINELGGLLGSKLQYIEIDDVDSTGDQVTTAFQRAVDVEKPDVIFSGYHLTSGPEFDIVANANRLYYNVNTQKAWTDRYQSDPEKYWSIFQCDPNDEWYGGGFAIWLNQLTESGAFTPEKKTAYLLYGDDTYDSFISQTFEEKIKEFGWEIVGKESFTAGNVADWGPLLAPVRDNPPAILFTTTYNPADNAAMIKQWVANPLPSLIYQQYGPSVPEYLDLAGDAANGVIWATVLGYLPDQIGQDFTKRYQAKFNNAPGWANAPGCFDEVWVWAKAVALAATATDYKRVAKMTEMGIHRGVTGGISFVNHGGQAYPGQTNDPSLGQAHIIVQIQNKEHKVISPAPYKTGEFKMPDWAL